jgi:hypothetical protein
MNKLTQKVELTANILVITVAVLLAGVIGQRYFSRPAKAPDQPAQLHPIVGAKINLPDTDWSRKPKTLILGLKKDCHFCSESAAFYKRLQEIAQNKNLTLVAVLPGKQEESRAYLDGLGIANLDVKQWPLKSLQISGTPTLILTNDKGEVTDYWIGRLSPEKELEVVNKL